MRYLYGALKSRNKTVLSDVAFRSTNRLLFFFSFARCLFSIFETSTNVVSSFLASIFLHKRTPVNRFLKFLLNSE